MKRSPVKSSNIASVGYDADLRLMEVQFKSGAVYLYRKVPPEVHKEFIAAKSIGSHFAHEIRAHYESEFLAKEEIPVEGETVGQENHS